MITNDGIRQVNEGMRRLKIRGNEYAPVAARIAAFRTLCPDGAITTEIVSNEGGMIIMRAVVLDEEGNVLATGHAYEREGSSQINGTSFVENCETSAVGRALGMLGIGSADTLASAEEMVNALNQQGMCDKKEIQTLEAVCKSLGKNPADVFPSWPEVSKNDFGTVMRRFNGQQTER